MLIILINFKCNLLFCPINKKHSLELMLNAFLKSVKFVRSASTTTSAVPSTENDQREIILEDIRINLPPQKIFTILGKNGSGKTTLIKSLTGLLDKRFYSIDGEVIFEDKNILETDINILPEVRKRKIKYVFQDAAHSFDPLKKFEYYFHNLTVEHPFGKDKPENKKEISQLLNYFILPEYTKISKLHSYEVSGGMAQRISFILALLAHPKLIILDEPTSGIDSAIGNLFLLKLKEYVTEGNNSVLLVTQDLQFAKKVSDKIAFLKDKKLSGFVDAENELIFQTEFENKETKNNI
jgi:peptide/nickel transport system ATP-binding protein